MFIRDGCDNRVIKHALLSPDERTVRLHDDVIIVTIIHDLSLLTEWMKLTQVKSSRSESRRVAWKHNQ